MSTSRTTTRVRHALAVGTAVATASLGVAVVAPAAQAVSAETTYTCTAGGSTYQFPVTVDTTAPARMASGATAAVAASASTVLPSDLAAALYGFGARRFDGTIAAKITAGTTTVDTTPIIPSTPIPPQTTPTAVPFTATSAALPYTAPATPGPVAVTVEGFVATLKFYNATDAQVGPDLTLTCEVAPPRKPVLIDTINVAAPSATTLVLDRTAADYGQDVTATAKVTTGAGAPDGDVAFSVDGGTATKVRVDKDGMAALALPDASVGGHTVVATFVPRDTASYDASTATQTLSVAKARTKMRVPVVGKKTSVATKVGVKAMGAFDTVPTGKVKIKLKRIGKVGRWVKVRKLSDTGSATAGFGKLKAGQYRVTVKYRGDGNHQAKTRTRTFRVRRG